MRHSGFQDILGLSLKNPRLWYAKLRDMATWIGRCYQQARVEALGTSQGVELEHGNSSREGLSEHTLRLRSAGWKKLISLRGETITALFLFQEGHRPMFRFKGEKSKVKKQKSDTLPG